MEFLRIFTNIDMRNASGVYAAVVAELQKARNSEKALSSSRFFKTGPGQYGEGDIFWGVTVPEQRRIVRAFFRDTLLNDVASLLDSPVHEQRLTGLLILGEQFAHGDEAVQKKIVDFYWEHLDRVNNWDLVDSSARAILGTWIVSRDRGVLDVLARSSSIWRQRVAMIATHAFILRGDYSDTLRLAILWKKHPHDLMQKAVGWMLREVGKKDEAVLRAFLDSYAAQLARTTLRYAIERFDEKTRRTYLTQKQ